MVNSWFNSSFAFAFKRQKRSSVKSFKRPVALTASTFYAFGIVQRTHIKQQVTKIWKLFRRPMQ